MINDTIEYSLLTDDFLLDLEDKIDHHTITVADSHLLDHYVASVGYPGFLHQLLEEEGVKFFRQAVRILRRGDFNFEEENDYPRILSCYWCCIKLLQEHLDRGEKIY